MILNPIVGGNSFVSSLVAFMSKVLGGGGGEKKKWKEDFHGSARHRVSVVKPNIRDSIPNTEPSMRVCRPRKIKNNCHPLQAPACFYKSIHRLHIIRSAHFSTYTSIPTLLSGEERNTKTKKTLISGLVNE